jgi:DnaJ C terminal domain
MVQQPVYALVHKAFACIHGAPLSSVDPKAQAACAHLQAALHVLSIPTYIHCCCFLAAHSACAPMAHPRSRRSDRAPAWPQVCDECPEVELERETVTLSLDIEPGMEAGQTITLYGEGDPHPDGDPGDLNVQLIAAPEPTFRREKRNLRASVQISLVDALTGFRHEIAHVDGHKARRPAVDAVDDNNVLVRSAA